MKNGPILSWSSSSLLKYSKETDNRNIDDENKMDSFCIYRRGHVKNVFELNLKSEMRILRIPTLFSLF